ncbi:GCN5-related N-acetyltransferase [Halogeometricum pallidum JCM 14848]|uniref:GCN5-related N-acetyltransferase n=1 Tax=Halogeometricum pallidum JCM 14848 TaxID=1227487 RepID=M0CVH9_HALPD|nr:GNAT family N-acetyltransferase [Halogeometricum pallidum]ELZ27225.1 GCN5-related N-acetyltransferase [Halogeometricum pallidum JCM 14848]
MSDGERAAGGDGRADGATDGAAGEALRIRPVDPGDAAAIRDIYAPFVEGTAVTFSDEVPSVEAMREKVRAKLAADAYPWYVVETGEGVVGYAYGGTLRERDAYQWAVETSVYVDPDAQRGGVGSALYERLFETLRAQGYVAAYAALGMPNPESVAFHEATGFDHLGTFPEAGFKLGAWHDVEWYRRALREAPADPDPPRPVSAVDPAFGDE